MEIRDNSIIILYTLKECIYCKVLKGKLKELNLSYTEIVIDNGFNISQGEKLEKLFKTESYPILKINNKFNYDLFFVSKTDLDEREGLFIFETIDQIINKLKEIYAL